MTAPEPLRTLREDDGDIIILDQTLLPHRCEYRRIATLAQAAHAIRSMQVRGAPLIGVTAAYGLALALRQDAGDDALDRACASLAAMRPTAVNLRWALERMKARLARLPPGARAAAAWAEAGTLAAEDVATNRAIGEHGLALLRELSGGRTRALRLMTHCNAGWLATCGWGTALAPVYAARQDGLPVHVVVSETRPRNQGLLTAWELAREGIPHTLIADNAAGHLMQRGQIDAVIVGADRIAANGDAANKIGTYLKALAAHDNGVPFFVAAPASTIDRTCASGAEIPIEERPAEEVRCVAGLDPDGGYARLALAPAETPVANPAFDVTPARLVGRIVCERGAVPPGRLRALFPEWS
ncbi:MAG: S-methyl-5-thioribose-1-phosphate isomerase [Rhodocyclaceae bacterium]